MRIAAIGECMIELSPTSLQQCAVGFGGDTLNTAIYMARLGVQVDYLTQLGDDIYGGWMLDQWRAEGVGVDGVRQCDGRQTGLYMIHTDDQGERSFDYWRRESPARELFDLDSEALFETLSQCQCIYLTGISLSLYKESSRLALHDYLASFRRQGGIVVFDSNYRPANWPSVAVARKAVTDLLPYVDIALPSFADEALLFGFKGVTDCIDYYSDKGVGRMVIKDGLNGCYLVDGDYLGHLPVPIEVKPVDTTAAGDSFNAGFLAAMASGLSDRESISWGQASAAVVIQHQGAIIDKNDYLQTMQPLIN